jgi:uncharacterized protein
VSRPALLDVNVLVALFDPDHIHHELAHDWFSDHEDAGWATCPITENGFVRVVTSPTYNSSGLRSVDLIERLRTFCRSRHHAFWSDSVSLRDRKLFKPSLIRGHRQLTDVYLLGLAVKMRGQLVTFDTTIPAGAVIGASRAALTIVSPSEPG